jgi:Kef-type K+ transport system membrane component KefB
VLPYLTVLAQVAVVIFMFAAGYEIEFKSVRDRAAVVPLAAVSALFVPIGCSCQWAWERPACCCSGPSSPP